MIEVNIESTLKPGFVEKVIRLFCDALGISVPTLLIYTDETITQNGICFQIYPDEFMILLKGGRSDSDMLITLAHEMVHVKQFLVDDLKKHFSADVPYHGRWWEQEAYEKEVELTQLLIEAIEQKKL